MKQYFTIFTLLFVSNIYSQNIDSLKNKFTSSKIEERVNLAIKISDIYFYSKPDSAEKYLNLGLQIAKSKKLKKEQAIIFQKKGVLANEQGNINKAKTFFKKTISLAKTISDTSLIISGIGNMGNSYMYAGEYILY